MLTLAPWEERERSQQEIVAGAQSEAAEDPRRADLHALRPNSLGIRGGGQGLHFAITGTDYDALADKAEELQQRAGGPARLRHGPAQLRHDAAGARRSPIDREAASDLGVSVETLGTTLATLLDGAEMGEYYVEGDAIPVRAQAPDGMIDDPSDLENIFVRTAEGRMVPLSSFVTVTERAVAPELPREGQRRAVPITATLAPGVDLRQAMDALEALAAEHAAGRPWASTTWARRRR